MKFKIILFIFFLALNDHLQAAFPNRPKRDYQVWTTTTATGTIKGPYKYWLESQTRYGENVTRVSQNILRTAIGYLIRNDVSLWFGYAWAKSDMPFTRYGVQENRIWQQFLFTKPVSINKFIFRTRMEERWIQKTNHTALRLRQMEKGDFPLQEKFSLVVYDEIFIHINNYNINKVMGFDQNRTFAGFGYHPKKQVVFEFGYLNQYIIRHIQPHYVGSCLYLSLLLDLE